MPEVSETGCAFECTGLVALEPVQGVGDFTAFPLYAAPMDIPPPWPASVTTTNRTVSSFPTSMVWTRPRRDPGVLLPEAFLNGADATTG
jgi:hypothetical protein